MLGGELFNIIPGEVHLEGTVRTYKDEMRATVERRMREILDGITRAGGGSYELHYRQNAIATVNDTARQGLPSGPGATRWGTGNVITVEPTMGGEDFAYFAREVPGFYFRLGVVAPGTTSAGSTLPPSGPTTARCQSGSR